MPKISVIMSVYNGEKYLREAIDSILNQTFTDFEFLIGNDCSTDGTKEILDQYTDPRLKILHYETNVGLTASLNWLLSLANGDYIARMDADDISHRQRFQFQTKYLDEHPGVGLVGSSYYRIDEQGRITGLFTGPKQENKNLWVRQHVGHGTFMIRHRALYLVGNYNEEFEYAQDYELLLRIAEKYQITNIPFPLYSWRNHPAGITTSKKPSQRRCAVRASIAAIETKSISPINCCRLVLLHLKAAKDEFRIALSLSVFAPITLLKNYLSLKMDNSYLPIKNKP